MSVFFLVYEFKSTDTRGKKILEQLSRPRFFPAFEISRSFFRAKQEAKEREISKPGKNRGLERCSNIFFPLMKISIKGILLLVC